MNPFDIVLDIADRVLKMADRRKQNRDSVVSAIVAIQRAVIATREFIDREGYRPSSELSNLWLDAFQKVETSKLYEKDEDFPRYVFMKVRFWSETDRHMRDQDKMRFVPTLDELNQKCEAVLQNMHPENIFTREQANSGQSFPTPDPI